MSTLPPSIQYQIGGVYFDLNDDGTLQLSGFLRRPDQTDIFRLRPEAVVNLLTFLRAPLVVPMINAAAAARAEALHDESLRDSLDEAATFGDDAL